MDSDCGSDSRDNLYRAELTQSPQKIYLDLKGIVILEQPERKFVLSDDERNLFIINSDETIIHEYVITKPYKPERGKLCELDSECSNGALAVLVPVNSIDKPPLCQVKFRQRTKTYTFNKINRVR